MIRNRRHPVPRYGVAVLAVALAGALTKAYAAMALRPSAFSFFYAAVMIAAWYGGLGPGIAATVLSALLANIYFISPYKIYTIDAESVQRIGLFTLVALIISSLNEARKRAESAERRLRR